MPTLAPWSPDTITHLKSRPGSSDCQPMSFHRSLFTPGGKSSPGKAASHSARSAACSTGDSTGQRVKVTFQRTGFLSLATTNSASAMLWARRCQWRCTEAALLAARVALQQGIGWVMVQP